VLPLPKAPLSSMTRVVACGLLQALSGAIVMAGGVVWVLSGKAQSGAKGSSGKGSAKED
jgi:hypothetical protein